MTTIPLSNVGPSLNRPALICALFGVGLIWHIAAWGLLGVAGEDALFAVLGPGPALAALHAMTGGTLLPIAIGACFQMLPVLCQRQPPAASGGWVVFALVVAGQGAQVFGLHRFSTVPLAVGAALTAFGLVLFILLLVPILRWGDFRHYPETRLGTVLAILCLAFALVLGGSLGIGYLVPLLQRPDLAGLAHGLLATYGFMGFLVIGFSPFVLPMVFLAKPTNVNLGKPVILLATVCLAVALAGVVMESRLLLVGGCFLTLLVAALHVVHMEGILKARMRRKGAETAFLCRLSWGCLLGSMVVAIAGLLGVLGDDWLSAYVILTFHGWLLSLLIAVIARILPFLAAMYTVHYCQQPALVTALAPKGMPHIQLAFHFGALALAIAACALKDGQLLILAGLAGMVSAMMLLAYGVTILWRVLLHRRKVGAKTAVVGGSTGYV